jgi:uncharacterized protein (TIGR02001 family)
MLNLKSVALGATLMLAATPAFAQEEAAAPAPDFTVTGAVTGVSEYRFRGVSLSEEDPALQGTINVNHSSGFYVGAWASSLKGDLGTFFGEASTEVDLYAGYSTEVAPGVKIDAGVLYYWYPGVDAFDTDFFEPYASVTGSIGPVNVKVGAAFAPKQDAIGDESNLYLYADPSIGIPGTPVTLKAHIGRSSGDSFLTLGNEDYLDWSIGADVKLFGPLTAGVAYVDTDLDKDDVGFDNFLRDQVDSAIVFSISASF